MYRIYHISKIWNILMLTQLLWWEGINYAGKAAYDLIY
jgi:hypothetical protein